jgi:hypothetical protein
VVAVHHVLVVFAVVCNFNSVKQALVMTLVKTVAFAGSIVLYTIISLVMFPLTATQQVGSACAGVQPMHTTAGWLLTAMDICQAVSLTESSMLLLLLLLLLLLVQQHECQSGTCPAIT